MARLIDICDIAVGDISLSAARIRVRDADKGIEELAASIDAVGLLEPIMVVPSSDDRTYELVIGQRRLAAHRLLGLPTIRAAILDERIDETTAKVLAITENLVRRDLNERDKIDVCTELYRKYGSIKAVAEETGLPTRDVSRYVKYDRLTPELRRLVDVEGVEIGVALRVQDTMQTARAADDLGHTLDLARTLANMTAAQQAQVRRMCARSPERPLYEIVDAVRREQRVLQIIVTLARETHSALQAYAHLLRKTQDEVAAEIIEEALARRSTGGTVLEMVSQPQ